MKTRLLKLRFRRRVRQGQKQVGELGSQAEQQLERHFFKRFDRLFAVRRFVIAWVGLVVLLIGAVVAQNFALSGYYQTLKSVPGGIYNEGVLGRFTNANPIYATSPADATVSRLMFAGLFTYDNRGKLTGDLAKNYEVDSVGTTYTVHLKPNLKWQDGHKLTSEDVVFTYKSIQNPDANSPLQASWQGVEVTAEDEDTVIFKLPGGLAAFPYNMTNGIVPKHLLSTIRPGDLRSADFNTVRPVGAGPFAWQSIQVSGNGDPMKSQQQIALTPFKDYQGGEPKLQQFVVHIYADETDMTKAFADDQLTAVEGLDSLPKSLQGREDVQENSLPLRAATMVFFKNGSGVLGDASVRQALVRAADVPAIVKDLGYPTRQVREPFLAGQVGYDPTLVQPGHDLKEASKLLDEAGWKVGKNGIRTKDGQPLEFTLTASDNAEYAQVTKTLKRQWQKAGVDVKIRMLEGAEFQNALSYHEYDALLYGITIGVDPDVFVYWDSSQADIRSANRLNLSEYKNTTADTALEAGRTRSDPTLRAIKYKPFLQEWQKDAPALALYQPRTLYLTNGPVNGLSSTAINSSVDRLNNVHNWMIREAKVTN